MGFQIMRVDAVEPCKISLPVGSHVIGRGYFLECNDHRVSRKHAELVVTGDSVVLKSLHQNPCFIKRKSSKDTIIFSQPDSHILNNGDQFGLIPDSYWYEVIEFFGDTPIDITGVTPNEMSKDHQNVHNQCKNTVKDGNINESDTQPYDRDKINSLSDFVNERSESPSLLQHPLSPTFTPEAIELLFADNFEDMDTTSTELSVQSTSQPVGSTNQLVESSNQLVESSNQPLEPTDKSKDQESNKRSHSHETIPYDIKKVKTEPLTQTPEVGGSNGDNSVSVGQPVKTEPDSPQDVKPGPSNVQGSSSNDGSNNRPAMPPSPVKPPNRPLRERCMYGGNCYRKNPQHKVTFSHPTDADWGSGPQGECPWGAGCSRPDPRHWRDHSHPPGTVPPPARPPGYNRIGKRRRRQISPESGSDDSEDDANLIVTGKRARKTIARQEWSDSDNDEDPYKTDDEDEWEPPSDVTSQEYSQSQDQE